MDNFGSCVHDCLISHLHPGRLHSQCGAFSKDPAPVGPWCPPVQGLSPSLPMPVIHTHAHIPINHNSPSPKTSHFCISLSSQLSLSHAHLQLLLCNLSRVFTLLSWAQGLCLILITSLSNESLVRFILYFLSSPSYLNLCSKSLSKSHWSVLIFFGRASLPLVSSFRSQRNSVHQDVFNILFCARKPR